MLGIGGCNKNCVQYARYVHKKKSYVQMRVVSPLKWTQNIAVWSALSLPNELFAFKCRRYQERQCT
jgi:hypothetical protein